jgi:hypothetical protein
MYSIASVTPTICFLMGIEAPRESTSPLISIVVSAASDMLGGGPVEKVLITLLTPLDFVSDEITLSSLMGLRGWPR